MIVTKPSPDEMPDCGCPYCRAPLKVLGQAAREAGHTREARCPDCNGALCISTKVQITCTALAAKK